jgi:acylglycerol lipase
MPQYEDIFVGPGNLRLFEQAWLPAGPPRATVVHVHGLIEHSGRHEEVAEVMAQNGYAVYAMDLRGHGRSEGPRCDVGSFDDYLLDLDVFFRRVRDRQPGSPLFLMGNSMGGLIVTQWAIRGQAEVAGLVLSGPLLAVNIELFPWLRRLGPLVASVLPGLRLPRIRVDLLSRSAEALESFRNDPLCFHGRFTVRVGNEILKALARLPDEAAALRLPLIILHGSDDRICSPAGSRMLCERAGSGDKTLRIYDGLYHEVFDEPEREQVLADLVAWLNRHARNE